MLLTDFGSARYEDQIKEGDRIEGTTEYLSPEAANGHVKKISDFWALGCVIYQMLHGRLPPWIEETSDDEWDTDRKVKFAELGKEQCQP